jgi:hypothetical protein
MTSAPAPIAISMMPDQKSLLSGSFTEGYRVGSDKTFCTLRPSHSIGRMSSRTKPTSVIAGLVPATPVIGHGGASLG